MTDGDIRKIVRLRAAERTNGDDAAMWRWYARMMQHRRLVSRCQYAEWIIEIDGVRLAGDACFDIALRSARTLSKARQGPGYEACDAMGPSVQ
jgi:hypothetical protein